jgi:hypothetical protein
LLSEIVGHLDHRRTSGAAVDALVRIGEAALAVVDECLLAHEHARHVRELLVRVSREIGGPSAVAVLRRHVGHRDREVGLAAMRALAALGPSGAGPGDAPSSDVDDADLTEVSVRTDLEHATHVLVALAAFADEPTATPLRAALRDELALVRQRVLAAFSMRHRTAGFNRVVFQLAQRDPGTHALALEWLDVTLTGTDRAVIALLELRLSDHERLQALLRTFPVPPRRQLEVLLDLVQDRDDRWRRPWLRACAVYAASGMSEVDLDVVEGAVAERASTRGDDEEGIVPETLTDVRHRRLDPV